MKIRTDFVTNSSSNSFIVAWPKKPDSSKAIQEMTGCDEDICDYIFKDTAKKSQKKEASNFHLNYWGYMGDIWNMPDKTREEWYSIERTLSQYYSATGLEKFFKQNPKAHIRVYEFDDSGCQQEITCHDGEVFGTVPHILISQH